MVAVKQIANRATQFMRTTDTAPGLGWATPYGRYSGDTQQRRPFHVCWFHAGAVSTSDKDQGVGADSVAKNLVKSRCEFFFSLHTSTATLWKGLAVIPSDSVPCKWCDMPLCTAHTHLATSLCASATSRHRFVLAKRTKLEHRGHDFSQLRGHSIARSGLTPPRPPV